MGELTKFYHPKGPRVELVNGETIQGEIDFGFIKIIVGRGYGDRPISNDTELIRYSKCLKCEGEQNERMYNRTHIVETPRSRQIT